MLSASIRSAPYPSSHCGSSSVRENHLGYAVRVNSFVRIVMAAALISSFLASCGDDDRAQSYSVGGTVAGLVGSGLVLANSNGDSIAIPAIGAFTFRMAVPVGTPYHVSVSSEPDTNPKQRCTVSNGDGTSTGANVTDVSVNCVGPFVYLPAYDVDYNTDTPSPLIYAFTMEVDTGALIPGSGSPFAIPQYGGVLEVDGSGHFAYLAVPGNSVYGFAIEQSTGALAPLPGSPYQFGAGAMQLDPTGRFAYAGLTGLTPPQNSIAAAAIDPSTGALIPIAGGPFAAEAGGPIGLSFSSDGRFLFTTSNAATVNGSDQPAEIYGFGIDPTTGALTPLPGGALVTGNNDGVLLDPLGRFAYVETDAGVWAYAIDAATGALSAVPGSPFTVGGLSASIDPQGRFLMTTQTAYPSESPTNQGGLWVYDINAATGALTQVAGSPFLTAGDPYSRPYFDPGGNFAYSVGLPDGSSIPGYTIDPASGALTPIAGSPFALQSGGGPERVMTFDPSGRFVYVQEGEYKGPVGTLNIGAFNPTTGAITFVADGDFPDNAVPGSITIVPLD